MRSAGHGRHQDDRGRHEKPPTDVPLQEGGTHTGAGGPVPPTGKQVEADYVYVMAFDGDRIRHMTKIWNDAVSLKQLGWM